MHHFPAELWAEFAYFACTDGGYTGQSLSLVSRFVHDATRCFRHRSVTILSEKQLRVFTYLLFYADRAPIRVAHLFVSVHGAFSWTRLRHSKQLFLKDAIARILRRTAPYLESLVIHDTWDVETLVGSLCTFVRFPVLRDLMLPRPVSPPRAIAFPALRRFHASTIRGVRCLGVLEATALAFPFLTHLRLTNVSDDYFLTPLLRVILKLPADEAFELQGEEVKKAEDIAAALPHLHTILVQPRLWSPTRRLGAAEPTSWNIMIRSGLGCIAQDLRREARARSLAVLPDSTSYTGEEAMNDWLDLVVGGDGPWSTDRA